MIGKQFKSISHLGTIRSTTDRFHSPSLSLSPCVCSSAGYNVLSSLSFSHHYSTWCFTTFCRIHSITPNNATRMSNYAILWLVALAISLRIVFPFEQRSDCVDACSQYDTSQEFGECLADCSRKPRNDNVADVKLFASPPSDVHISTTVIMDEGKILETTIRWLADDLDTRRTGFYIRYTALNATCQTHFPGFFTSAVSPTERSFTIPAAFNGHTLIIEHGCTYRLQIRSIPYPAVDDKYTIVQEHTVPECIDKYCSCKAGDVAEIENLQISNNGMMKWDFVKFPARDYTFFVDVYEKVLLPFKLGNDEYTWRIANHESYTIDGAQAGHNAPTFSYQLPYQLKADQQYKVSIFAIDDRFCHNEDAFVVFNSSATTKPEIPTTFATIPINVTQPVLAVDNRDVSKTIMVESSILVALLIIIACLSPVCTLLILFLVRRHRKENKLKNGRFAGARSMSRHSIMETNILYRRPQDVNGSDNSVEWQIRAQDIAVGSVIGEGAFGLVFKGILRGPNGQVVRVAVKQLKANAVDEEREEFVREIQMMQIVGQHDNIVTMYGYCMDDNLQCMIMEYVPFGDLKHYLQNIRKQISMSASTKSIEDSTNVDEKYTLDAAEAKSFATQAANGMAHLESLQIIHRDLAARNILVGIAKVLKISDFGMSRPGVYVKMSKGVIPLRWLSPEAIQDNTYSSKSDVWAYGVLLWEITTVGGFPYANIADKDILPHLSSGKRLERPPKCSDELFHLQQSCWNLNPDDRPEFSAILATLRPEATPTISEDVKIEEKV